MPLMQYTNGMIATDQAQATPDTDLKSAQRYRHWIERCVPHGRLKIAVFAVVLWSVVFSFFAFITPAFSQLRQGNVGLDLGSALFFASMLVVAMLACAMVVRRSGRLLQQMDMLCSEAEREALVLRVMTQSRGLAVFIPVLGIALGSAHTAFLFGIQVFQPDSVPGVIGTVLVWLVATSLTSCFLRNSQVFAEVGAEHLRVDLLRPEGIEMLGQAAALPVLGLMATQVLYPFLWIGGDINLGIVGPGFAVTTAALIFLFVRQVLPVHRRLVTLKHNALREIDERISKLDSGPENLLLLNAHIEHRKYLQDSPEWPFRLGTLARWTFYLLIPPLTWVGAALIEMLVDSWIGG